MKLGETIFGVTVWAVLPGRQRGQQTGLAHLTWGGPGDAIHLRAGGTSDGHVEHYGRDTGSVSGPCHTEADAQKAAEAYLEGLAQDLAAGKTHGPAAIASPDPSQLRTAIGATGAAGVLAAEHTDDETARILAEYGTPEMQLQYVLWEAARLRRDAYQAAAEQLGAAGNTAAARQRHDVAYEAAHGRWAAETAIAVAWYARVIGAAAPAASSDTSADTSPYNHGWSNGNRLLMADITSRPDGYDDNQWREYVAGYAEGARLHAKATILYAEAVREQVQRTSAESRPGAASPGHAVAIPDGPGRDESVTLAAEPAGDQAALLPAGSGTPDMGAEPIGHLNPLSPEYAREYNNGWRASERAGLSSSYQVLSPLERADLRNVTHAWYDGYHDHAAGRPKWTYRQAREAGFDSADDYLIAQEGGTDIRLAGLPGGPAGDVPGPAGADSASLASPNAADPGDPADQQPGAAGALGSHRAGSRMPGLERAGSRIAASTSVSQRIDFPGQVRPAATGPGGVTARNPADPGHPRATTLPSAGPRAAP